MRFTECICSSNWCRFLILKKTDFNLLTVAPCVSIHLTSCFNILISSMLSRTSAPIVLSFAQRKGKAQNDSFFPFIRSRSTTFLCCPRRSLFACLYYRDYNLNIKHIIALRMYSMPCGAGRSSRGCLIRLMNC